MAKITIIESDSDIQKKINKALAKEVNKSLAFTARLLKSRIDPIIKTALTDPFKSSQEYSYATSDSSDSQYYVVFSVGPDGTADITGINTSGVIQGDPDDDIYISNGTSGTGGF